MQVLCVEKTAIHIWQELIEPCEPTETLSNQVQAHEEEEKKRLCWPHGCAHSGVQQVHVFHGPGNREQREPFQTVPLLSVGLDISFCQYRVAVVKSQRRWSWRVCTYPKRHLLLLRIRTAAFPISISDYFSGLLLSFSPLSLSLSFSPLSLLPLKSYNWQSCFPLYNGHSIAYL